MEIQVTEQHIRRGIPESPDACPLAQAITQHVGFDVLVTELSVEGLTSECRTRELTYQIWENKPSVSKAINHFDRTSRMTPGTLLISGGKMHFTPQETADEISVD